MAISHKVSMRSWHQVRDGTFADHLYMCSILFFFCVYGQQPQDGYYCVKGWCMRYG